MKTNIKEDNVSYNLKRFAGIKRDYSEKDVENKLESSIQEKKSEIKNKEINIPEKKNIKY